MGLYHNSPSFSYVSATGITVVWNGEVYVVADFYSNKKYIYWSTTYPNQFNASNVMPARSANQFLILINDNGIATQVPNDDIEVYFDGNSVQNIRERIYGLYEKNEEIGEQFSTMYQDIQGIHTSVGKLESDSITIHEEISRIDQKADNISLEVKDVTKVYNDDKEASALRESVNSSFIKLNANLGTFKSELQGYFDDNSVSTDERTKINEQLSLIETAKNTVITNVDRVIAIAQSNSPDKVAGLNSAKTALNNTHTSFKNIITGVISDNIVTPSDITLYLEAFAKYSEKILTLKNTCDEVILLGTGGQLVEELARLDIHSNEISLSVKKVEKDYKSELNSQKLELEKDISEVSDSVGNLENTMNGAFQDNILSESEKTAIRHNLSILELEKSDIDKQYTTLYSNVDLTGTPKTNLKTAYDNYIVTYNTLVSTINTILNKSDLVEESDKTKLKNDFNAHSTKLGEYTVSANNAIDAIALKKSQNESGKVDEKYAEIILNPDTGIVAQVGKISSSVNSVDQKYAELILNPDTGISTKVGRLESGLNGLSQSVSTIDQKADGISMQVASKVNSSSIISAINMSPEDIRISASKVNIDGYVTFTSLQTSGATIIHGDNITSGIITGARLRTTALSSEGGVWIEQNGIQIGSTSLRFGDGNFRIETSSNTAYASTGDIALMPRMSGGTPTGEGFVTVNGTLNTNKLIVNGREVTGGSMTATFG